MSERAREREIDRAREIDRDRKRERLRLVKHRVEGLVIRVKGSGFRSLGLRGQD